MKFLMFTVSLLGVVAVPMQKLIQRPDASAGCISKYYNKDLGPLEILMMPLGEKLWLRAWLGMHMSNLLHMEGVDLSEVAQNEEEREKRSVSQMIDSESENKFKRASNDDIIPYSYHVKLQPFVNVARFHGELQINFTCVNPTNSLVVHISNDLKVDELSIRSLDFISNYTHKMQKGEESLVKTSLEISKIIRFEKMTILEILLPENLVKDTHYEILFNYIGPMSEGKEGIFFHTYEEKSSQNFSWFVGTNIYRDTVKNVFPCFCGSKYKATVQLSVAHPEDMITISSSSLFETEYISSMSGWQWSHFKATPPMILSSLSIFIINPSHFVEVTGTSENGVNVSAFIQTISTTHIQKTVNYLAYVIPFLETQLGVSFPMPQLNILFLPSFSNHENDFWGVILTGPEISPPDLVFHLLKQWFGHFITAKSKSDEFITRSLATYYAYSCSMGRKAECETGSQLVFSPHTDFIALQDVKERMSDQEFKDHKMVLFMRMLNFSLSETSFQRGIQVFLKYRSYSTFIEEDLWDALDIQAWSDGTLDRTISTKDISVSWMTQDILPLVTISRDYQNETLIIKQQAFVRFWPYRLQSQDNIVWQIPISFITENELKQRKPGDIIWLKEKKMTRPINPQDFGAYFIANFNNAGMYIISYDNSNWQKLSESLLNEGIKAHFSIPSETRASIMRNAWYLATTGNLDFTIALNSTCFLKYEKDITVWKTFVEVYFMVSWKLLGTGVEILFDRFIGDLLVSMYEKLKDEHDAPKEVQALAYYVMCKAGYDPALRRGRQEFSGWLQTHHEINHGVVGGVLRWIDDDWEAGLQHVLDLVKANKDPKSRIFLLTHLAANPDEGKIKRLMKLLLIDPEYTFSKAEIMNVLPAVCKCENFLEFLNSHWETLQNRYASEPNMWDYILEQATKKCKTPKGLEKVEEFYKFHQNSLGTSVNAFKHHIEIIRRSIEVVFYQIPEFEEALNGYLKHL